jgi:hypothetical protein
MSILDRDATAGRIVAAVATLPARAALKAVAAVTGTVTAAAQAALPVLRAAGIERGPAPVAATTEAPPAAAAAQQSPAAARPRPSARVATTRRTEQPRATAPRNTVVARTAEPPVAADRSTTAGRTTRQVSPASAASPAEIRAWAAANGYVVGNRGRMPDKVREAYAAAH